MTFEHLLQEWTESEKNDQNDILTWWKRLLETRKFKRKINVTRLIKLRKIMWHVEHVEHKRLKNWECMTLMSYMSSMMHVEHVKHDTLKI